eukprot:TRINITY_DN5873_c0_g3_i1.p1 TRINITY_DN5873_c0_g3~~TRINITY_DN5873_c0_g3_i1.p1  ORF type:complete len:154 (-),score=29.06 TRINITY_DN5873_c0_g3_i1:68-529(-)
MEYGYADTSLREANTTFSSRDEFDRFQLQYAQDSWFGKRLTDSEIRAQEEERRNVEAVLNFGQDFSPGHEEIEDEDKNKDMIQRYDFGHPSPEDDFMRQEHLDQLSEYQSRFQHMLSNVKLASVMLNREWDIVFVNPRFFGTYGLEERRYNRL